MRRALAGALVVGALAAAFLAGRLVDTTAGAVEEPAAPAIPATTPVRIGLLEEEVALAAVEVTYEQLATVTGHGGTVTSISSSGSIVAEGDVLLTIDLRPLVVLTGEIPMFRSLAIRDEGADVSQLQAALQRLGFYDGATDGVVGPGTMNAWIDFLESLGFNSDRSIPQSEILFVSETPIRIQSVATTVGADATGQLMTLSRVDPKTIAILPATSSGQVEIGSFVEVLDGQEVIEGKVQELGRIDQELIAVVNLDVALEDGRTYRARILIPPLGPGLIVPVTAIHTASDGSAYVSVLHPDSKLVDVEITMVGSSATEALVTGSLTEGDELVVSQ